MALVNKRLVWNVFEQKIAAFNQTLDLIFFVNSGLSQTNTIEWQWHYNIVSLHHKLYFTTTTLTTTPFYLINFLYHKTERLKILLQVRCPSCYPNISIKAMKASDCARLKLLWEQSSKHFKNNRTFKMSTRQKLSKRHCCYHIISLSPLAVHAKESSVQDHHPGTQSCTDSCRNIQTIQLRRWSAWLSTASLLALTVR